MSRERSNLASFLTRVHRRHLAIRLIEHTGIGLSCGGVLAIAVICLSFAFVRPATTPVAITLAFGSLCGLIAGCLRRPTKLDSAIEADHQLRLADLLSSAMTVRDPRDPWAATVIALANQHCTTVSPSQILLKRWGGRAWGTLGLATALLFTISLVIERSSLSQASTNTADVFASADRDLQPRPTGDPATETVKSATLVRHGRPNASDDTPGSRFESTESSLPSSPAADAVNHSNTNSSSPESTGTGSAQSVTKPQPLQIKSATLRQPSMTDDSHGKTSNGGVSGRPGNGENIVSGTAAPTSNPPAAKSPWTASSATPSRSTDLQSIESRPAYQPYRDLIQAYFDRE